MWICLCDVMHFSISLKEEILFYPFSFHDGWYARTCAAVSSVIPVQLAWSRKV